MTICNNNKWEYILRLKEERMKRLVEKIKGIEKAEKDEKLIKYWNNVKYGEVQFEKEANVLKFYEKKKEKTTELTFISGNMSGLKIKKFFEQKRYQKHAKYDKMSMKRYLFLNLKI